MLKFAKKVDILAASEAANLKVGAHTRPGRVMGGCEAGWATWDQCVHPGQDLPLAQHCAATQQSADAHRAHGTACSFPSQLVEFNPLDADEIGGVLRRGMRVVLVVGDQVGWPRQSAQRGLARPGCSARRVDAVGRRAGRSLDCQLAARPCRHDVPWSGAWCRAGATQCALPPPAAGRRPPPRPARV